MVGFEYLTGLHQQPIFCQLSSVSGDILYLHENLVPGRLVSDENPEFP